MLKDLNKHGRDGCTVVAMLLRDWSHFGCLVRFHPVLVHRGNLHYVISEVRLQFFHRYSDTRFDVDLVFIDFEVADAD